ncbi:MAG: DUF2357 domain-containing protein [Clostridia bacterium]|nr:DUF2357 domain-containing protein [Clostridia bacterium]
MESHHISKFIFFDKNYNALNESDLIEWSPVVVGVNIKKEYWFDAIVYLNGKEVISSVKKVNNNVLLVVSLGRLSAGGYVLSVREGANYFEISFTINPKKISYNSFKVMIEQIVTILPMDIAISMSDLGGLSGNKISKYEYMTIAQFYHLLRDLLYGTTTQLGIYDLLHKIKNKPHNELDKIKKNVNRDKAKHTSNQHIINAMRRSSNLDTAFLPRKVVDMRIVHDYDVIENQIVKRYILLFQKKATLVKEILQLLGDNSSVEEIEAELGKITRLYNTLEFMRNVSDIKKFNSRPTMVQKKNRAYRDALQGYLSLNKTILMNLDDDRLLTPLENTPYLYQVWGTLITIKSFMEILNELGYTIKKQEVIKIENQESNICALSNGTSIIEAYNEGYQILVRMYTEKSYTKYSDIKSVSFTQRPDVSVEIFRKEKTGLLIIDPKYKLTLDNSLDVEIERDSKPKKIDIDKMHAYSDSIRVSGERVVEYAAIIYPGETQSYTENLEALKGYPGSDDELILKLKDIFRKYLKD